MGAGKTIFYVVGSIVGIGVCIALIVLVIMYIQSI
jgi:hypothetical protein